MINHLFNAGDDASNNVGTTPCPSRSFTPEPIVASFQRAAREGIHRTVHAGENSPASAVLEAIEEMQAERIGHGYSGLLDNQVYQAILLQSKPGIHFEACDICSFF
ncbi:unnamed protein product [Protopolystoma xenopodis]|uniref:adenosine deaminase n=1 Tax=Protopolystoma xenopodis TaxID=117903 RepID=A0A3S5BNE0_9PLAT|nr:unnamed protein product [Protopolystoma xenopodis]